MIHDRNREYIERFGASAPHRIEEPLRVEIGPEWVSNRNAQNAFLVAVNLATRFTDSVVIDSPRAAPLDVWHPIGVSEDLRTRALEICEMVNHPAVSADAQITVSFGGRKGEGFVIRPSVHGWVAEVETDGSLPSPPGDAYNPLSSGFAACLAMSEAFKEFLVKIRATRLLPHRNLAFSLLTMDTTRDGMDQSYPFASDVGLLTVVGAGALGHSLAYGFCAGGHRGTIHIVDDDTLDSTNMNRHIMVGAGARGNKATVLAAAIGQPLQAVPSPESYENYRVRPGIHLERVVSLVDDRNRNETRRQIQSDLPQALHHGATGETSFTILNVDFVRAGCLGCLFAPPMEEIAPAKALANLTGLPVDRVVRLGTTGLLQPEDLEVVGRARGYDPKELRAFLGQPVQSLIDSKICGEQSVMTPAGRLTASVGFLSAAAGLAVAAEVVKVTSGMWKWALDNFLQVSPFSPGDRVRRLFPKDPRCSVLCSDPLMQRSFLGKWQSRSSDALAHG